ncbi:hypothetical protein J6S39_00730 [Candidatus Saccharibacteria bacterium]|nr:hypothetical protein [Candidatus Saccharibacteria bacterium]
MKANELERVPENKIGRVDQRGVFLNPHEAGTILYLTQFGLDIEVIRPTNTNKSRSADIVMLGTAWEIKSPTTSNISTIKEDFRKAMTQSDKIIFDLRRIKKDTENVEKHILRIFKERGRVRRLMIISKDGKIIDFRK